MEIDVHQHRMVSIQFHGLLANEQVLVIAKAQHSVSRTHTHASVFIKDADEGRRKAGTGPRIP